jgi:hypothetical protein
MTFQILTMIATSPINAQITARQGSMEGNHVPHIVDPCSYFHLMPYAPATGELSLYVVFNICDHASQNVPWGVKSNQGSATLPL